MCVCSLRYPACNVLAPYCHLWSVCPYCIFPHYFINGTIFEKEKVTEHKMGAWNFFITFFRHISHSKKNSARDNKKLYIVLSTCYSCYTLKKPADSRKMLRISNFINTRPFGAELFHADGRTYRQTDRHDGANIRLTQFFEHV